MYALTPIGEREEGEEEEEERRARVAKPFVVD